MHGILPRQVGALGLSTIVLTASLAGCPPSPANPDGPIAVGQMTPTAATSSSKVSTQKIVPHPPPGRGGWFYLHGPQLAWAAPVATDLCVVVQRGRRWLITPDLSVAATPMNPRSMCDGVAAKGEVGWYGNKVLALKDRLFFADDQHFYIADPPLGPQRELATPFSHPRLVETGDSILALASPIGKDHKATLYRLNGETWTTLTLDSGKVTSVLGSPDGQAYAVTTKNLLYRSIDAGATWKSIPQEKGLILGQLSLDPSEPGALGGAPSLSVKRLSDGAYLGVTLSPEMDINSFIARFLTTPPNAVTTVHGTSLAVQSQIEERLNDSNVCGLMAQHGSSGVVACDGASGGEIVLRHTEDGGKTVREIARFRPSHPLVELALTDASVLMLFRCRGALSDECRSEHVRILERGAKDVWTERRLDVPGQSNVYAPIPDRTLDGGFYLRGTSLKGPAEAESTALIRVSSQAPTLLNLTDKLQRSKPDQPLSVGAMTVNDDGTLSFIVREGAARRIESEYTYQRLTKDGAPLEKRVLEGDGTLPVLLEHIGLVGRTIVMLHTVRRALYVSDDAGKLFTAHNAGELQSFELSSTSAFGGGDPTQLACGSAGCDFINKGSPTRLAWRWGTEPLRDTLTEERSKAIEE